MSTIYLRFSVLGGYSSAAEDAPSFHEDYANHPGLASVSSPGNRAIQPISIFPSGFFDDASHEAGPPLMHRSAPVPHPIAGQSPNADSMRNIPAPVLLLCDPAPSISVLTFMQLTCSMLSPALQSRDPKLDDTDNIPLPVFSDLGPTELLDPTRPSFDTTLELIAHICIHNPVFASALSSKYALEHASSIIIPHIDSHARYPPWIARFIAVLGTLSIKRAHWASAMEWIDHLDTAGSLSVLVSQIRSRLTALDWNSPIPGFSYWVPLSTLDCASLLGSAWITSDIINACGEFLMAKQPPRSRVLIINTHIVQILQVVQESMPYYTTPPHLRDLDEVIRAGVAQTLYIPIYTPAHWSLLSVDFVQRRYWYVDPSSAQSMLPDGQFSSIEWWLRGVSPGPRFLRTTPPFLSPRQDDTYSCGVIVMSMMAHCILGLPLWSSETREVHRAAWFLHFTSYYGCENVEVLAALMATSGNSTPTASLSTTNPSAKRLSSSQYDALLQRDSSKKRRGSSASINSDDSLTSLDYFIINRKTSNAPSCMACRGLTSQVEPLVRLYLARVATQGGGARSRLRIAEELFGRSWYDSSEQERHAIRQKELAEYKWVNDHCSSAIFSIHCLKHVPFPHAEPTDNLQNILKSAICTPCKDLMALPTFCRAIKPIPSPVASLQYVPIYGFKSLASILCENDHVRRLLQMSNRHTPLVSFSRAVSTGELTSKDTFLAFFRALTAIRVQRMHSDYLDPLAYSPPISTFLDNLAAAAPRIYTEFSYRLGGGDLARQRQSPPGFEAGISVENIRSAMEVIQQLQYTGPLSLVCNETMLLPGLQVYPNADKTYTILGGIEPSHIVKTEQELEELLQSGLMKADQLRAWFLSITLPEFPLIPLASEAATAATLGLDLQDSQNMILELLHQHRIQPCSYPTQGSRRERTAQQHLTDCATSRKRHTIRSTSFGLAIELSAPIFGDIPMHFPTHEALSSTLHMLGGLFNAWTLYAVGHLERIQLALRARMFLTLWRTHIIEHEHHSLSIHFISPAAYNVLLALCDSLIMLILVYRDHFPSHPLLPWLHSTDRCEHVFALLRSHKSDFNHSDFLQFMPKVMTAMTAHYRSGERAYNGVGLDGVLKTWPTDLEIDRAYDTAIAEAKFVLANLGVRPADKPIVSPDMFASHYDSPIVDQYLPPPQLPRFYQPKTVNSLVRRTLQQREQSPLSAGTRTDSILDLHALALVAELTELSLELNHLPVRNELLFPALRGAISRMLGPPLHEQALPETSNPTLHLGSPFRDHMQHSGPLWPASNASSSLRRQWCIATVMSSLLNGASLSDGQKAFRTEMKNRRAVNTFASRRRETFTPLFSIHSAMRTANVTPNHPIQPGSHIIFLHDGKIVLGEAIAIYAKSRARFNGYNWVRSVQSLGMAAVVCVVVLTPFVGDSLALAPGTTFLRVPVTHILFHFGPSIIAEEEEGVDPATGEYFCLCRFNDSLIQILTALESRLEDAEAAVAALCMALKD
ncbi:hypothetical protein BOTBODRAFT_43915 [Botryobasidium botryosum FD-172 SS1]|uniref:Ubiquitin-like protease family profile domain-containing protein n=1 Tax=Botryobasidium botryosum (strain FD-172 SS1) TaxID=930990 RepID=A0A067MLI5_BOTB1|nr:hypothetical protein BOTBODRAFT_43915 [Botryobasidium botryosum FD-172 SS1]